MSEESILCDFLGRENCAIKEEVVETEEIDENIFLCDFVIKEEIEDSDVLTNQNILLGNFVVKEEILDSDVKLEADNIYSEEIEPFSKDIKVFSEEIKTVTRCAEFEDKNLIETYIQKDGNIATAEIPTKTKVKKRGKKSKKAKSKSNLKKTQSKKSKVSSNEHRRKKQPKWGKGKFSESDTSFCSACDEEFPIRCFYDSHLSRHFTHHGDCFTCDCCGYETPHRYRINYHVRRFHCRGKFSQKNHACDKCEWKFIDRSELEKHKKTHLMVKPYSCVQCGSSFYLERDLRNHVKRHKMDKQTDKQTNKQTDKQTNKARSRVRAFPCEYCSYEAEAQSHLDIHIKRHFSIKNVKCDQCDYSCTCQADLTRHYVIHLKDRPYQCDKCSKMFKRRSHIVSHFHSKYPCKY